tara:strand:- start:11612 stop:12538 length:927 start_codon:yes stop_codon:yes gene_type:complete
MLNYVLELKERETLYDDIRRECDVTFDAGIYIELGMTTPQKNILKILFENYIIKTLESYYEKNFETNDLLIRYRDEILGLPNRTPNGAFYPKVENIKEYNEIQSFVNDILVDTKLVDQFESFDLATVRIVDGKVTDMDSRPSATSRLHSDAWAGHAGDAILTIGVLGDETTSLEFNKTVGKVSSTFFETQDDYEGGLKTFENYDHISDLDFDTITIFDHACLHRTLKNNGGLRVSLDVGLKLKSSDGLKKTKNDGRKMSRIEIKDILKIGKETFVEATETLEECYKRFKNDKYDGVPTSYIHDTIKIG